MNRWHEITDDTHGRNRNGFVIFAHHGLAIVEREYLNDSSIEEIDFRYRGFNIHLRREVGGDRIFENTNAEELSGNVDAGILNVYRALLFEREGMPSDIKDPLVVAVDSLGKRFPSYRSSEAAESER